MQCALHGKCPRVGYSGVPNSRPQGGAERTPKIVGNEFNSGEVTSEASILGAV